MFLGIVLLFQSCSDNETSSVYSPKENVQGQHFSLKGFEDAFVRENLEVDWSTYLFRKNGAGQEIREYPTKLTISRTLNNGDKELGIKYTVLYTKDKDSEEPDYSVLKYVGEDTKPLRQVSFFEKKTFSGPVYFYNLDGQMLKVEAYKEGKLKKTYADKKKGLITAASKFPSDSGDTGYMDWVKIDIFTDWYNVRSNGSRSYNGSTLSGSRWEYVWVPGSTGGTSNTRNSGNYHEHGGGRYGPSSPTYRHEDELITEYPSCESFEYTNLSTTGVQVAAVYGIYEWVYKIDGDCSGVGVAVAYQTYYFQLPSLYGSRIGARKSADALASAFYDLEHWYRARSPCSSTIGVLAQKMDDFIKAEFLKIGGVATRVAPLGWSGSPAPYIENWTGRDFCN